MHTFTAMALGTAIFLGSGVALGMQGAPRPTDVSPAEPAQQPAQQPSKKPAKPANEPATTPAPGNDASGDAQRTITVAFPHPIITEILYAVPSGDKGDANKDGTRHATGDEFVEFYNPHDREINLKGYAFHDKSKGKKGALEFIFPECRLKPKQCAVVFNGFQANISGPLGDSQGAPKEGSPKFGGAMVFTMKNSRETIGLANAGDAVVLAAPDGTVIEIVKWGKITEKLPDCKRTEEAPTTNKCSVQRRGLTSVFVAHDDLDGLPCSPGTFSVSGSSTTPATPPAAPADGKSKPKK